MKILWIILICFFFSFRVTAFEDLTGTNLICKGKYQVIGYEFLSENKVIRHASFNLENDYYKNQGFYILTEKHIKLDVEGDIFTREVLKETLELFIGVHLNNSKVGKCVFYNGKLNQYFSNLTSNEP